MNFKTVSSFQWPVTVPPSHSKAEHKNTHGDVIACHTRIGEYELGMNSVQKKKSCAGIILLLAVVMLLIIGSRVFAAGPGTTTAEFLKLGAGAGPAGMANACTAKAGDASCIYFNPGALSTVETRAAQFAHASWLENITFDWLAGVYPSEYGTFGMAVQYLSYGQMTKVDELGVDGDTFNPNDLSVAVAYGRMVKGIGLGLSAKYISSRISNTATAIAIDAGAYYPLADGKTTLGCAAQNLGTKMKFIEKEEDLPLAFRAGARRQIAGGLSCAVDAVVPTKGMTAIAAGAEYRTQVKNITVTPRAGYSTVTKDIDGLKGWTAGVGITFANIAFDYAFVPYGELGSTHRMSAGVRF